MTAPVSYHLSFARAAQHLVDVSATFDVVEDGVLTLQMPAWSPGSYMIRDYARNIEGLLATGENGEPLALSKISKDTFAVDARGTKRVTAHYAVYGRELTVRTNFICDAFALIQGTATLLGCATLFDRPHQLEVQLPSSWQDVCCGLQAHDNDAHCFVAASYDAMVDSPLLLGTPHIDRFDIDGVEHVFATEGGDESYDHAKASEDARAIVRQNVRLWRQIPYQRYVFLNVLHGGGGGLEHHHSSVLMGAANARASTKQREDYAGLIAHEHFHAWNIKQLRPLALGPFDYQRENYTPSLWVAEGLTAYYDDLQACRANLVPPAAYLARLAKSMEHLQNTPGRFAISLRMSSFDAWTKLYKTDENTINSMVSYYLKGSLVGFVLDAQIRQRFGNARSLDDVMRLAYSRYSQARGYTEEQFRVCVGDVVDNDPAMLSWLDRAVDGIEELEYGAALSQYGLDLSWHAQPEGRPKHRDLHQVLGVHLESPSGNAVLSHVLRHTPAYSAGLNVGDELVAINDWRVKAEDVIERLTALAQRGTQSVSLLISRRGRLLRLQSPLQTPRAHQATLAVSTASTATQTEARALWLGPVRMP